MEHVAGDVGFANLQPLPAGVPRAHGGDAVTKSFEALGRLRHVRGRAASADPAAYVSRSLLGTLDQVCDLPVSVSLGQGDAGDPAPSGGRAQGDPVPPSEPSRYPRRGGGSRARCPSGHPAGPASKRRHEVLGVASKPAAALATGRPVPGRRPARVPRRTPTCSRGPPRRPTGVPPCPSHGYPQHGKPADSARRASSAG